MSSDQLKKTFCSPQNDVIDRWFGSYNGSGWWIDTGIWLHLSVETLKVDRNMQVNDNVFFSFLT